MFTMDLKPGRERSLLRRHPWIFSGAIAGLSGDPQPGDTVEIVSAAGEWLARGAFSPQSQITARVWTFNRDETVDAAFFRRRIRQAAASRSARMTAERTACRIVHGESDRLPGLVVDRYAEVLVAQFLAAGAERWKAELVAALADEFPGCTLYERSDPRARSLEGLEPASGPLRGGEPPERVRTCWAGLAFDVDVRNGHKTGAYLDQADTLPRIRAQAAGADVLDAFCYAGAFTLAALAGDAAHVLAIDSSEDALRNADRQRALNDLPADRCEWRGDDVFTALRDLRDRGRSFDLVILDPPKFADSKAHVERACRAYKDINLLAFKLLRPGGRLATFSCSGSVEPALFQKVVADAALDAGRFARVVEHYAQAADHPVSLAFPEGFYLKGLLCEVLE